LEESIIDLGPVLALTELETHRRAALRKRRRRSPRPDDVIACKLDQARRLLAAS
jgi:hypothetical protein